MGSTDNSRLVLILCMITTLFSASKGDPRTEVAGSVCSPNLAVSGDILADYFVPAMGNLSSLVNQNGFATTVVGEGPNIVFGLTQCFDDLSSVDCRLCFSEIRSLLPKCYPKTGGRIFLDGCFGRYENFSFFNETTDSHDTNNCFFGKNSSNPVSFLEAVKKVVTNVSLDAQRGARFAVGYVSISNLKVYALAQCWESLNKELCGSCLRAAASSIVSCAPGTEGRALNAGCYMRYSTESFWNSNLTASHSSGKSNRLWIILGSVGGVLILVVSGIVLWKKKRFFKKLHNRYLRDLYGSGLSASSTLSKLNFQYNELKKATKNFNTSNKLGQGSYGTVYKGVLSDGKEVAIKRLFLNTRQWADQFFNEVDLVNQVRHKNLVKLLGCSADGPESLLVYEYYYNKSLDQFIFDACRTKQLDWKKRFDIIQGVAEGLSYLHEESEIRIIHRDIKASNILLDEKFKAKITDFGLARSFSQDQTHLSTGIAGTLGYMAPEYIVHGHLTEKADVYSFGILTLEILTGKRCSEGIGSQTGQFFLAKIWNHYKANSVEELIDRSFYDVNVKGEIMHAVEVGLLCTQATPSYRPTMTKVVELLRSNSSEGEMFLTGPPFLDVEAMAGMEEGECSHYGEPSSITD